MWSILPADSLQVFVSIGRGQSAAVIGALGRRVVRIIEGVGVRSWRIAVSPDSRELYTAQ